MQPELVLSALNLAAIIVLLLFLFRKRRGEDLQAALAPLSARLDEVRTITAEIPRTAREDQSQFRKDALDQAAALRKEISDQMKTLGEGSAARLHDLSEMQQKQLAQIAITLADRLGAVTEGQTALTERLDKKQIEIRDTLERKLGALAKALEEQQIALRNKIDEKLKELRDDNAAKLEEMRKTVDEKLQTTLEKRLGDSFTLVSTRLEEVHKGLGEMQTLAGSVGDLKRTLTNVKTRGTWAEAQLGALISDMLSPEQFIENAQVVANSLERVEFAVKLPGRDKDGEPVLLAIDSKFPVEDYDRLVAALDVGNLEAAELAGKELVTRILSCAADIKKKYINPPHTTDFAIMYLPTEGLFAEVIRRPGLASKIQRDHRVVITGPTTLSALLSSLQVGFRTLAIEKRSSEVWEVLGAVKTEFSKFGDVVDKVKKKLQEAGNQLDSVDTRTRVIKRHLRTVEGLPDTSAMTILKVEQLAELEDVS